MIATKEPTLVDLTSFMDPRGSLGVIEGKDLPFEIKRIYYILDVPIGAVRGEHGHKCLKQLMVCMNGACDVTFNDGTRQFRFRLDDPFTGLFVPPGLWRKIRFEEPDSVLCVLASHPYERDDYIHSYEEFVAWTKREEPSTP